jgi:hypothetical protein
VAEGSVPLRAFVNVVMKLGFQKRRRISWSLKRLTVSLSRFCFMELNFVT